MEDLTEEQSEALAGGPELQSDAFPFMPRALKRPSEKVLCERSVVLFQALLYDSISISVLCSLTRCLHAMSTCDLVDS